MRKIISGMFIRRDVVARLTQLKHQPAGTSPSGPAFEGEMDRVPLKLPESRAHGNGVVALRYARAD